MVQTYKTPEHLVHTNDPIVMFTYVGPRCPQSKHCLLPPSETTSRSVFRFLSSCFLRTTAISGDGGWWGWLLDTEQTRWVFGVEGAKEDTLGWLSVSLESPKKFAYRKKKRSTLAFHFTHSKDDDFCATFATTTTGSCDYLRVVCVCVKFDISWKGVLLYIMYICVYFVLSAFAIVYTLKTSHHLSLH